jgi:hypothetical protein
MAAFIDATPHRFGDRIIAGAKAGKPADFDADLKKYGEVLDVPRTVWHGRT